MGIEGLDLDRKAAPARPSSDGPRDVRVTCGHIQDPDRGGQVGEKGSQMIQDKARAPQPAVDPGEIFQGARQLVGVRAGQVDQLSGTEEAGRRSHHRRRAPSAAKPGPRAIMTPQSPACGCAVWKSWCRTKRTVAEDMF